MACLLGEESAEVLDEEHGAERVDLECLQRELVVDLGGRFLGVQDAWVGEGEAEVVV